MSHPGTTPPPSARATTLVLVATAATAAAVLGVPALRPPGVVLATWAAVALVLLGVVRHRPRPSWQWLAIAVVLSLWATATAVVQHQGRVSSTAATLVLAGQVVAVLVTTSLFPWRALTRAHRPGRAAAGQQGVLDGVIIATVLGLVTAQLVAAAVSVPGLLTTVVVPVVDVALLGLLVSFVATRRLLQRSSRLLVAATVVTVVYDLSSAVQGLRLALPGDPAQVVGVVCVLLFGAAAVHPTMPAAFSPATLSRRRAPSAALLGLLPLVAVPLGLWWVGHASDVPGLPTPVLLAGASAVAALCLLRACGALRTSEHLADHDPLTDLVNRRGLARAFADAPGTGWALLLVDVDDFKQVNDAHGHGVGDDLLLRVRDRLLAATGPGEVVARLGGDEFVVLTSPDRARPVADGVLRSLREPVLLDVVEVRTSASVGLAGADPSAGLDELLTRADVAMYTVKDAGRDGVATFAPRMREEVSRRYGLTGELRRLLGREAAGRDGALEVHYQPLVELVSGRVVGAEALVRWQHPRHGLLGPAAFLDLVGASGLDADLDAVVLRQVVQQLARWREDGLHPLPVSVNLTCTSLLDPRLDERVLALLASHDVPPSWLHLEITEHEELPPQGPAGATLRRLRAAGAAVHLDDYGTGYTSLSYLRRFPVEVLKLDRSVVEVVTTDDQAQLVAGIGAMAATLGLDVLAEGVETPEQRDRLVELGVRYGQGYLFSRPLAADVYAARVLGPATARPATAPPVTALPVGGPDGTRDHPAPDAADAGTTGEARRARTPLPRQAAPRSAEPAAARRPLPPA